MHAELEGVAVGPAADSGKASAVAIAGVGVLEDEFGVFGSGREGQGNDVRFAGV